MSNAQKVMAIVAWLFTRSAVVVISYTMLKFGQFLVLRFV